MTQLNYHHLRYFHAIAREGSLTKAADRLNVSQSALSIQLKKLEESLGCFLFEREHKTLSLTEEGRMVLNYADAIFRTGEEMLATLHNRGGHYRSVIRVGAVSTLSKNFQITFLSDALDDQEVEVVIYSANLQELIGQLKAHTLDIVLSNSAVPAEVEPMTRTQIVAEQAVSLIAPRDYEFKVDFRFPQDLQGAPVVLPSRESSLRSSFNLLLEKAGIVPLIAAEANDMATLRLIAREVNAITLVPPIVVLDELRSGELKELCQVPNLRETFYAITADRRFPNRYVQRLLDKPWQGGFAV
ncbi:LysR family transcriptional regulator [Pelagicoccus sp. SDUM812003]|uniref:LysR family transcriptional regulator n=1 Tax=Pelagicoccus sp. SDUM812003 TaxID=3041267 RepID=UPI00280D53C9|nr:LysR family transcriptional regulator [Pelagicoccus sp. SDUM812003]MDQ8204222.1 LysR family transcriptional regulator [Pelagicoccus sp. SDUM812003]